MGQFGKKTAQFFGESRPLFSSGGELGADKAVGKFLTRGGIRVHGCD